jgi:hypothetical protein
MSLQRTELFSIPVWHTRLPEMQPYEEQLRQQLLSQWQSGQFQKHQYGYGYQTPSILFDRDNLVASPAMQTLHKAFVLHVREIRRLRMRRSHAPAWDRVKPKLDRH